MMPDPMSQNAIQPRKRTKIKLFVNTREIVPKVLLNDKVEKCMCYFYFCEKMWQNVTIYVNVNIGSILSEQRKPHWEEAADLRGGWGNQYKGAKRKSKDKKEHTQKKSNSISK